MRWLSLIGWLWLSRVGGVWAQVALLDEAVVPRRMQFGIDVLKTPAALIGLPLSNYPLKKESFLTIEPVVRFERQKRQRYWQGQAGFTRYTGAPTGDTYLTLTGGFLKAGTEWQTLSESSSAALLLTVSAWQTGGEVRIPAGTFAPAVIPIPLAGGGAIGAELQTNRNFRFNEAWTLRLLVRYNVFLHTDLSQSIAPKYLPGLGLYRSIKSDATMSPVGITAGVSLQLLYTPALYRRPPPR